ncbi:hypothetical protein ACQVP2_04665 [Methylobacterium aquaticum]|uniref:hypothetical protein n=1 Tax=Methylobacterium aquaticum TaxID=270351 RepID=UPI003D16B818
MKRTVIVLTLGALVAGLVAGCNSDGPSARKADSAPTATGAVSGGGRLAGPDGADGADIDGGVGGRGGRGGAGIGGGAGGAGGAGVGGGRGGAGGAGGASR